MNRWNNWVFIVPEEPPTGSIVRDYVDETLYNEWVKGKDGYWHNEYAAYTLSWVNLCKHSGRRIEVLRWGTEAESFWRGFSFKMGDVLVPVEPTFVAAQLGYGFVWETTNGDREWSAQDSINCLIEKSHKLFRNGECVTPS